MVPFPKEKDINLEHFLNDYLKILNGSLTKIDFDILEKIVSSIIDCNKRRAIGN